MAIREKAGVIAKKIEGNPIDPEKIAKDKKEEAKEESITTKKDQLKSSLIIKRRLN